jgi:hypothetical protein
LNTLINLLFRALIDNFFSGFSDLYVQNLWSFKNTSIRSWNLAAIIFSFTRDTLKLSNTTSLYWTTLKKWTTFWGIITCSNHLWLYLISFILSVCIFRMDVSSSQNETIEITNKGFNNNNQNTSNLTGELFVKLPNLKQVHFQYRSTQLNSIQFISIRFHSHFISLVSCGFVIVTRSVWLCL